MLNTGGKGKDKLDEALGKSTSGGATKSLK
jgi:hypothetical protein